MKRFPRSALLLVFLLPALGCAHNPHSGSPSTRFTEPTPNGQAIVASRSDPDSPNIPEVSQESGTGKTDNVLDSPVAPASPEIPSNSDDENLDYVEEENAPERAAIADPLEPFNRAVYHFNDKLYFWVLRPVARGYGKVVPEAARVGVRNFFSNIASPIRIVNCVLQGNFAGAARELGRFVVNTVAGVGGFLDPASDNSINLPKQDEDFGQTLGVYGLGQGFYINWPIFGPSSPRDTVGMVADLFLHPFTYLVDSDVMVGVRAYERVNTTSLTIGDYESLKNAAVDPYVAIRDAYVQYRLNQVKRRGGKSPPPGDVIPPPVDTTAPSRRDPSKAGPGYP